MLSLPPHTSHKMQPLDITFFKPLKTYYHQNIEQWLRTHPGRGVTMFQLSKLFGIAYGKAATVSIAVNGFRKSGIFPCNPLVFNDSDFCPAEVTDRPNPILNSSSNSALNSLLTTGNVELQDTSTSNMDEEVLETFTNLPAESPALVVDGNNLQDAAATKDIPGPPVLVDDNTSQDASIDVSRDIPGPSNTKTVDLNATANSSFINVEQISPLPKRIVRPGMKQRNCSKSTVLTSSPHKRSLVSHSTCSSNTKTAKRKNLKKSVAKKQCIKNMSKSFDKDYACLVCGGNEDEDWIQCSKCEEWAHEQCADLTDARFYYCDNCV